jgi:hypothetical protein
MDSKLRFILCLFIAGMVSVSLFTGEVVASGNCLPLYNGGITGKQYCLNPTTYPAATTGQNTMQQSGSDQKVYPSSNSKTTPNTGPETWSLVMLFFLGGTGLFLINKAKT